MKFAVVVPTYRRPEVLRRCLAALAAQERPADELIVVSRFGDEETAAVLAAEEGKLRHVQVDRPGVVAALAAGVAACTADVVAFTDDDAAPRVDWLGLLEQRFADAPDVGGVGGRDWCWYGERLVDGAAYDVGRLQWFGRMTSGHHIGTGAPREVDVLKGVNMAFRRHLLTEIGFDDRLRGDGAQVHFEMALGFAAKRGGWRLLYDPCIAVDHYPSMRIGEDQRESPSPQAIADATHNETLIVLEQLPPLKRVAYAIWGLAVGTWSTPGLVAAARLRARGAPALGPMQYAQRGRAAGWRTFLRSRRIPGGNAERVTSPPRASAT